MIKAIQCELFSDNVMCDLHIKSVEMIGTRKAELYLASSLVERLPKNGFIPLLDKFDAMTPAELFNW